MLRGDRRIGSSDRRLYRELIYAAVRHLPWIEPLLDADPERATRAYRAAVAGDWPPCPDTASGKAAFLGTDPESALPAWFRSECPAAFAPAQLDALLRRAPLWVRLQSGEPREVLDEFDRRGWPWTRNLRVASAVSIRTEADLTASESFRAGRFEIQDIGSQAILDAAGVEPGGLWLDACAGAGGKTLQLATLLGPAGRVRAHDIRPAALDELDLRARRAGLSGRIERLAGVPDARAAAYDGVLVDAPCSGSGTWRRSPHLKWATAPARVRACARAQLTLLSRFALLVRPGGRLIYATCSLCRTENEDVASAFLAAHPSFSAASSRTLLPADLDGDGYFACDLRRA
jgi:16S rRNA (cytosine967-C5)-methyltransferase